jgi:hypothetical protein
MFSSLLDGGNTLGLLNKVEAANSLTSSPLTDSMFNYSPYLSTIVLQAVAKRGDIWGDSLLYQLLRSNPDALGNTDLIDSIQGRLQRWMIDSLNAIDTLPTNRTALENTVVYNSTLLHDAVRTLIYDIYDDSTGIDHSSIRGLWALLNEPEAQLMIASDYMVTGQHDSASALLNLLRDTIYHNNPINTIAAYYLLLDSTLRQHTLFMIPHDSSSVIDSIDTIVIVSKSYEIFSEEPVIISGNYARSMLRYFGNYNMEEWPILPQTLYSDRMLHKPLNNELDTLNTSPNDIKVFPNPANEVVNVQYRLNGLKNPAELTICDLTGKILYNNVLHGEQGQCIIPVDKWNIGSFIYNIRCSEKGVISGGVFIVTH